MMKTGAVEHQVAACGSRGGEHPRLRREQGDDDGELGPELFRSELDMTMPR